MSVATFKNHARTARANNLIAKAKAHAADNGYCPDFINFDYQYVAANLEQGTCACCGDTFDFLNAEAIDFLPVSGPYAAVMTALDVLAGQYNSADASEPVSATSH